MKKFGLTGKIGSLTALLTAAVAIINWFFLSQVTSGLATGGQYLQAAVIASEVALCWLISWRYAKSLVFAIGQISNELEQRTETVQHAAQQIAQSSHSLSDASTNQAAALQETAASIDEVSSMVIKNSESAANAESASEKSRSSTVEGQEAINEMVNAIESFGAANREIFEKVASGNQRIAEIVHVIADIETKTKIINDIVFQTRLLSFNASVEAARAGEHGKGFAVVAEEIGNLAEMSGTAAKEISTMLEQGVQTVNRIVQETQETVEKMVSVGTTRAEHSSHVAQKCAHSFAQLSQASQRVNDMIREISSASREQATGIAEITKAINQLNQSTAQTTTAATSSAKGAADLSAQATSLTVLVERLTRLQGQKNKLPMAAASIAPPKSSSQVSDHLSGQKAKPVSGQKAHQKTAQNNGHLISLKNEKHFLQKDKVPSQKPPSPKAAAENRVIPIKAAQTLTPNKAPTPNSTPNSTKPLQSSSGGAVPQADDKRFEDL